MKRIGIIFMVLMLTVALGMGSALAESRITFTEIEFEDMSSINYVHYLDENGKAQVMPGPWDDWFENATVGRVYRPSYSPISLVIKDGGAIGYEMGGENTLIFTFIVDGKEYPLPVGVNREFIVEKTSKGGYRLMAAETAALWTAPPEE